MNKKYEKAKQLLSSGKFKQARDVISKYNKSVKYSDLHSIVLQGICEMELGIAVKAKELFSIALSLSPEDSDRSIIHSNLYSIYLGEQNDNKAIAHLLLALEYAPFEKRNDYRMKLAKVYYVNNDFYKTIEICKKLQVYHEYTVKSLFLIVHSSIALSDYSKLDYYLRQLEGRLNELNSDQLNILATLIGFHRSGDVSQTFFRIIQQGGNPNVVNTMLAQHMLKEGDVKGALPIINQVEYSAFKLKDSTAKKVYFETKAQLALQSEQIAESFAAFKNMNEVVRAEFANTNWQVRDHYQLYKDLPKIDIYPDNVAKDKKKNIAFLVGFPRSGTTLLESILDTLPQIASLSEKPVLLDVGKVPALDGHRYPESITKIPDEYRQQLRDLYYEKAKSFIGSDKDPDNCLLIDKNPFEMMRIPLILSIFPEAKIILAVRHPLDCVLSCFMQNFRINPQLAYFTDLESTFERYHKLFSLYQQYKDMYQFDDHIIRYEDVVADLNGSVKKLLAYLQIDTDQRDFSQFDQHAKKRVVNTPSAQQVRNKINNHAVYRWKTFNQQLSPYKHIVEPYIKQFGYE